MILLFLIVACKKEDYTSSLSLIGTHWEMKVVWESYPDTIIQYVFFDENGFGTDMSKNYDTLNKPFSWELSQDTLSWKYNYEHVYYTGEISESGNIMSGTCLFDFPIDEDLKGIWYAKRR